MLPISHRRLQPVSLDMDPVLVLARVHEIVGSLASQLELGSTLDFISGTVASERGERLERQGKQLVLSNAIRHVSEAGNCPSATAQLHCIGRRPEMVMSNGDAFRAKQFDRYRCRGVL